MLQPQHLTFGKTGLKKGLQLGYNFEAIVAGKVPDVCENNNLIVNNANPTEGVKGNGLKFHKPNNSSVSEKDVDARDDFTISFWIKLNPNARYEWHLTLRHSVRVSRFQVYQYPTKDLKISMTSESGKREAWACLKSSEIDYQKYYHFVIVFKSGIFSVYKNSLKFKEKYIGASNPSYKLRVGNHLNNSYPASSSVDELYMWRRALAIEEIIQLYNGGNGLTYNEF